MVARAAEGFAKVFAIIGVDGGPDSFFRICLCTAVSRLTYANNTGNKQLPTNEIEAFGGADEHAEPIMDEFGVVSTAFRLFPERWQPVFWYSEVAGTKPVAISPLLGFSANASSALACVPAEDCVMPIFHPLPP
ncbi:hypothetical protein [Paeniglutamicibacter cryotolerans]|uniref:Uncharacterized protein n=1 Tax=Paeniglutamicibacter cryotolerans TaxID=670079 RepID=A0A839QPQ8_9MICC|nr:hypothetical protein [Paeniglutamicibacter cryotolerans]MBB2994071.1 hypothetical protein [Paeniglutamicibacter cryotolerans]